MKTSPSLKTGGLSLAHIEALPDDPLLLKEYLCEQAAAIQALQDQLDATQPPQPPATAVTIEAIASGIGHEFNNILAAMLGFTELTQDLMPQGSTAWANLDEVRSAGQRAKDLMQQVMAFSRPQAKTSRPASCTPLVTEALDAMRPTLPDSIDIRQQLEPDSGYILADRSQIYQLVQNLCSNAADAMHPLGGTLTVTLSTADVQAAFAAQHPPLQVGLYSQLTVQDTGHGMTPHTMESLFKPFFTTKLVGNGTGLGLAIVHRIVRGRQGAIIVDSIPDSGSTFEVYLPQFRSPLPPRDTASPREQRYRD